ncbi:MAG: MarR family transcriptional regulator [Candidatus Aenigmarchaeota archaeon]|nr:MarR family transcriptional regulator [Candidatus Aenigmarchaeota archaeon]
MKKLILLILAVFALLPIAHASISDWSVDVAINDDGTTTWTANMVYNETVSRSDYFVLTDITNYEVSADGLPIACNIQKGPGSLITCENITAQSMTYIFRTNQQVIDVLQNYRLFTYRFPITQTTGHYSITIRLPLGSALVDASVLKGTLLKPFDPEFGIQGSDGRYIYVTWNLDKPKLGENILISVVFEQISEANTAQLMIFVIILVAIIVVLFLVIRMLRRQEKNILPILTANERKIMEILIREKGEADQRVLVKETDYSKAKVSRLIKELSERGLIEKVSKGRKNLIKLKKSINPGKLLKQQSKEKNEEK